MPVNSFRDLTVWQRSMDLVVATHAAVERLPHHLQSVLGDQLRKSSRSMPSNIAEGWSRHSTRHSVQHLWTADGSGAELETQLEVGKRLGLIAADVAESLIRDAQKIGRMLNGLARALEARRC